MTERTCQNPACGKSLEGKPKQARYCDDTCKQAAYRNRNAMRTVTSPDGETTTPDSTVPERTVPVMNNRRTRRAEARHRDAVTEAKNTVAELRTGRLFTQASAEELAANDITHAGHRIHPHDHRHIPPQYRYPQRCSSRWWCETCKVWFTDINCFQED